MLQAWIPAIDKMLSTRRLVLDAEIAE